MKIILKLLLATTILLANASGQIKCTIDLYTTENGLSHDVVTKIIKDREGFMWFATWNGINRFDGHNFVSYKSFPGDSSQLKHDRIDVIVEDNSKHLWLRGADSHIYRFDKKTEQFLDVSGIIQKKIKETIEFGKIVSLSDGSMCLISISDGIFQIRPDLTFKRYGQGLVRENRLPSNVIHFVHEDRDKNVWVGTPRGLGLLLKSKDGNYKSVIIPGNGQGSGCRSFNEDGRHLYFGTEDGSLLIYDKVLRLFRSHKLSLGVINNICVSKKRSCLYLSSATGELITFDLQNYKHTKAAIGENSLFSIYEDRSGYLWVEPEKTGIIRVDPIAGTSKHCYQIIDRKAVINNRFRVFEDINGTVWVNMKGGGFGFYSSATGQVEYFYNEPGSSNRQFSNIVYDLFYDKAGVLWLSTDDNGITKIVFRANNFNLNVVAENAKFRSQTEVRGLLADKKDRLWVGAKSGKLLIYQGRHSISDIFINKPSSGLGMVYTMLEDRKGNIWLGTKGEGLWKATPINPEHTKYRLSHYRADATNNKSLSSNQVYALLEDRKGRIWVGTFDKGLNLALINDDEVSFVHSGRLFRDYPDRSFGKIRHLALDPKGHIWIATTDGLLIFDPEKSYRYKRYNKMPGDRQSLGNNDIQFIFKDSKGRMWLGTSGGGLDLANGHDAFHSLKFRNYTTKQGLPNDFILSCAEDHAGNLWIATQNGLSKFVGNSFRNFDSYDGLPKARFSEASSVKMKNGSLIFGTTKGYISFNPETVLQQKIPTNIVFTNLQINNEDVLPSSEPQLIDGNINYLQDITLKHNQNIFSIDYATLDYRFNNKQSYAYRLKGFDNKWRHNKNQRRVSYTNIPPGRYVFEVRSLNGDLYSNSPGKSISLTILPPFWRTWWAYCLYFVICFAILEFVRRTALTMLRLRNKITVEQKLAELKTNFFTNISHEIRTPLTLILNPIEELARHEQLSSQGITYVNIVRKNANRMVRFINQLLDLRKLQSGKATLRISEVEIVSFLKNICEYFAETADKKHIALEVESAEEELYAWIDAEKIDIVIYNLLANAFKFTPDGRRIRVVAKLSSSTDFVIEVHDQGQGVEQSKLRDIFELYYEGDTQEGNNVKGTGIGLALSKELVELHGGQISAFNNSDKGLTVIVQLKLDIEHSNRQDIISKRELSDGSYLEESLEHSSLVQQTYSPLMDENKPMVLLVEDNSDLRDFLKQQLSEFYRVEVAKDGEEGLKKALKLIPDLILSDVMMPKMDGIQMLGELKNHLATSHIPVILLTAKSSVESQIEGLKYGADYYITKPFNNAFLRASIDNLIKYREKIFEGLLNRKETIKLSPGEVVITSRDETFLKKVIQIVENGMMDPDFNIDTVSETINMGRTTFYKKFKSLTGLAPVEFVRDMRLQRSKQLLDAGEKNISTVAYSVGFNNAKYFSTCFKEKYHVSPSLYLNSKESAL